MSRRSVPAPAAGILSALAVSSAIALAMFVVRARPSRPVSEAPAPARTAAVRIPLRFEENRGQAAGGARFLSHGRGYSLALDPTGPSLVLSRPQPGTRDGGSALLPGRGSRPEASAAVRLRLVKSNPAPRLVGEAKQRGIVNYLLGSDPKRWRTRIPTYAKVRYRRVYPGVDLVYHGGQGQLEYDFEVRPGADPSRIRMSTEGAEKVELAENGDLLLHVPGGTITQKKPVAYQVIDGEKREVPASFVLRPSRWGSGGVGEYGSEPDSHTTTLPHSDAEVTFQLARYDATRPLVIDPVLAFSSYLGGDAEDYATAVALDASGCSYVAGYTNSSHLPSAGGRDAFVTKLAADGTGPIYSTYLGGGGEEFARGIAVDASGSACLVGDTYSPDFPTQSPLQSWLSGTSDAFVARLSADGSSLTYSTYLGGSDMERCNAVALDAGGAAYLTGTTGSSDYPTQGSLYSGDGSSCFLTKLAADGQSLGYSTFLGGSGLDAGTGVAVAADGTGWVVGFTSSNDLPTPNGADTSFGGTVDGFAMKVAADGSSLLCGTYLGGGDYDEALAVVVGSDGSAYVTGGTQSGDFPTLSSLYPSQGSDAFVTKIGSNGAIAYSTYLGGGGGDSGYAIAVGADGAAYVTGLTTSGDFPSVDAFDAALSGATDAFVTKLAAGGGSIAYSTYLGGGDVDSGLGIAVTSGGSAWVVGQTQYDVTDFPLVNPVDSVSQGVEAFVARVAVALVAPTGLTVTENASALPVLSWTSGSPDGDGYRVERKRSGDPDPSYAQVLDIPSTTDVVDSSATPGLKYTYRVRAYNATGESAPSSAADFTPSVPTAPSSLSVSLNAEGLAVALIFWEQSRNETGFEVQRSVDGTTFIPLTNAPPRAGTDNQVFYVDPDISGHRRLWYRVRAVNEAAASAALEGTVYMAVTDLAVSEGANLRPVLSWSPRVAPGSMSGFRVERKPTSDAGAAFETALTTSANTGVEDTTATLGVAYTYRVRVLHGTYPAGPPSTEAEFVPSPPQQAPSGLTAGFDAGGLNLVVRWSDNSPNERGFEIEARSALVSPSVIGQAAANATSYVDATVAPYQALPSYRVRAVNDGGGSAWTDLVLASPAPPFGLTAVARSATKISLTWQSNAGNFMGFEIQAKQGAGSFAPIAVLDLLTTSYDDAPLAPNTTYSYRVRSVYHVPGELSVSDWAGPATATTAGDGAPAAPSNLQVFSPERGRVNLTWSDNSGDEAGFKVYRRIAPSGAYSLLTTLPADANTYGDTTTTGDTTYGYTVAAYNDRGTSPVTDEQRVTTLWGPETLTAAAVTTAQVGLTWKDMTLFEDAYSIERQKAGGSFVEAARVSGKVGKNQTLTYTDTGLTSGVVYTYRVRAYNSNATSVFTTNRSITTTGAPEPGLQVTPAVKSYGRVPKGQARTATFTVKNTGKKWEAVTIPALGGAFEVLGSRHFTLKSGATRTFKVRFTAGRVGVYAAELPVRCQHGEVVRVKLDGRSIRN
jgi:hypothetical protein